MGLTTVGARERGRSGWTDVSIGTLARFSSGQGISVAALHSQSHVFPVPVYGGNGIAGYTATPCVSDPTIVVGRVGQRCGEVHITEGPAWVTDNALYPVCILQPLDLRFFGLALSAAGLNDVKNRNDLPLVTQAILHSVRIPWPLDIREQEVIAAALSDVDALLGALDRLIAKKRDLKQAAMQQLLTGQTRLPGFSREERKPSALGEFPSDWEFRRLAELVEPARGIRYGIVQPGRYDPHGRYMIRGQDYSESKGWASPADIFRVSAGIEERYRNARVRTGDLIMTIVGYCGHVEQVPDWLDDANLTQTTARIAIDAARAVGEFCKYALQSAIGKTQVASYIKGAAQPGLNCGDVEQFLLPIPSRAEQRAIAAVLSDMDGELTALEQRRAKTQLLKQGMMQELLTGRTRLL